MSPVVDARPPARLVVDTRADRRALIGVIGAVLVLGLALVALGQLALTRLGVVGDAGVTVIGTVDLVDPGTRAHGCEGVGVYSDVRAGTPVTVTDGTGAVLGSAELGGPLAFAETGCLFTFRVAHVPTSAHEYSVRVGGAETVVSTRDAMEANGWTAEVHLDR